MTRYRKIRTLVMPVAMALSASLCSAQMAIVRDGKAVATIVVKPGGPPPKGRRRGLGTTDAAAATVLVNWVRKMSGAELPVAEAAPAGKPAVYVGAAAVEAGLKLDDIDSPTREGLRIVCDGKRRLLLAGQSGTACVKAACLLLEKLGCRYFMDHPLGEVAPAKRTVTIGRLDITQRPGLLYRSIWGSRWGGQSLWKIWNGAGGLRMSMGHAWGGYVSKDLFKDHPEYFALRPGGRKPSDWYCTSNPDLRKVFAEGVIGRIRKGTANPSVSPPDGRGYCQCPQCAAQDDPKCVEPSSGHVCMSNRYLDFLDHVGRAAAKASPQSILSFYAYADYTQAPTVRRKASRNLCVWIAPIRYSRYHHIGSPNSTSRTQLKAVIDGWTSVVGKMGYRTYNYNLAECLVPFSKIGVWKHDIPYLKRKGCIGINLETLHNWEIYGPHIWLSIRLAYDPAADADALMEDYFEKFYGPKAGPAMKEYWLRIDKAFAEMKCESGSFFALHLVYTDEFLAEQGALLATAAKAAKGEKAYEQRVAMTREGYLNAAGYARLRKAMNRGDFAAAKSTYDALLARNEREFRKGLGNHYTTGYLKRFVGVHVAAGAAATARPNKLLAVLPDRWRLQYDPDEQGLAKGFHKADHDDGGWKTVATYSNTLHAQGLPDRQTILWYRTAFDVRGKPKSPALFFTEVDGGATVYVNGKEVGEQARKRKPFEVDITSAARPGRNVVSVRVDHSKITELFLGGIIRPVLLIGKPR